MVMGGLGVFSFKLVWFEVSCGDVHHYLEGRARGELGQVWACTGLYGRVLSGFGGIRGRSW